MRRPQVLGGVRCELAVVRGLADCKLRCPSRVASLQAALGSESVGAHAWPPTVGLSSSRSKSELVRRDCTTHQDAPSLSDRARVVYELLLPAAGKETGCFAEASRDLALNLSLLRVFCSAWAPDLTIQVQQRLRSSE